jgi:hypothetical protein
LAYQSSAQSPNYYFEERSNEGNVLLINFSFAGHLPEGDLADRYGLHSSAGGGVEFLTGKNYIFGLTSHFIFGNNIEEDVLAPLYNEDGFIFGANGTVAELQLRQRGLYIGGHLGKLFRLFENHRSGIRLTVGAGLYQHKIRIQDDPLVVVPFLSSEYKKGYDRLTNGLGLTQFVGYQHLGRRRRMNFMIGFEFTEAFTQNRRSFNYDTRVSDTESRLDLSIGLKIGWTLPLYIGENEDLIEY